MISVRGRQAKEEGERVSHDPLPPGGRVKGEPPWPEMEPVIEASGVYLLTMRNKVTRTWGERPRPVPEGALVHMRIVEGIKKAMMDGPRIDLDEYEPRNKHYNELRYLCRERLHFVNPQEEEGLPPQRRAACFALTPGGEAWARSLLAEAEAGHKLWRPDWLW
jgi:hypothetical protein